MFDRKGAVITLLFLFAIALSPNVYSDVIINEIMYNPSATQGDDSDLEWVELFNNGNQKINLENFTINGNSFDDANITAGGFVIVARELIDGADSDLNSFEAYYGNNDGIWNSTDASYIAVDGNFVLENTAPADIINLSNGSYTQLVNYTDFLSLANGNNKTLIFYNENFTESAFINGTPGSNNDQFAPDFNKWANPSSNSSRISGLFNITVNITDATAVNAALVNFNNTNFSMSQNNGLWRYLWNTSLYSQLQFNITIFFNDSFGASGTDELFNITVNKAPIINITVNNEDLSAIAINETQKVNITLNASDLNNDALSFSINDSRYALDGIYFVWNTDLNDSGNYVVSITVNDSELTDSKIIDISVLDASDLDNDGNPNFNDTDDDNDRIPDDNDFLIGNISNINTTLSINLTINGTSNLSRIFNGTFFISITNKSLPLVEFNWTFNSTNMLNFAGLKLNRSVSSSSAVSISGINMTNTAFAKTIFLEKINQNIKSVCIKDNEVSYDDISSACNANDETLVLCNNVTSGGYACYDTGERYKITGLKYSAVKEQCRDIDGDGYGAGCSAGSDCDDNDASKTTDCSSQDSGSSASAANSGGGSGGGFSGYICSQEWVCGDWSACLSGKQARNCELVKIPAFISAEKCSLNEPEQTKPCKVSAKEASCSDKIKNHGEAGVDCGDPCKPCFTEEFIAEKNIAEKKSETRPLFVSYESIPITGLSVQNIVDNNFSLVFDAISYVIVLIAIIFTISMLFGKSAMVRD